MKYKGVLIAFLALILPLFLVATAAAQGRIAFQSCGDNNCEIYIIDPDGTNEFRLTFNSAQDLEPFLGASGTKILFASNRGGLFQIYSMNPDGTGQIRLTNSVFGARQPAINRNAFKIAYVEPTSATGTASRIAVANADGSLAVPITMPRLNLDPSFSPDGSRIAFLSYRDGNQDI